MDYKKMSSPPVGTEGQTGLSNETVNTNAV